MNRTAKKEEKQMDEMLPDPAELANEMNFRLIMDMSAEALCTLPEIVWVEQITLTNIQRPCPRWKKTVYRWKTFFESFFKG